MFDRHSMSADFKAAQVYMRTMAHLPLLLHSQPRRALVICYGIGTTTDAIRTHDSLQRIDVVDLNPSVFLLSHHFGHSNRHVLGDRRVRIFCEDGRQFLKCGGDTYDLITLEPPPPLQPGISRLYSLEFYRAARSRLSHDGLVSQWLPESQMDQSGVDLVVSTFVKAFSHSLLFVGHNRDLILVGSPRPLDFAGFSERFVSRLRARQDLLDLGFGQPHDLASHVMRFGAGLRREWSLMSPIRDGFASLEAIQISPVQQLHRSASFVQPKANLYFDIEEVRQTLAQSAPELARKVARAQADPASDPHLPKMIPRIYFPDPSDQ
jgi:hypothetical protein